MGFLDDRWIQRRDHDWREWVEWVEAHGWSDLRGELPALAVAAGWPQFRTSAGVVLAAEGEVDGRGVALVRHECEDGEGGRFGESVVWAELRRVGRLEVAFIRPRLFQRHVGRRPVTGNGFFDSRFKVSPKQAAPDLPWGLVAAISRLEPLPRVVLTPRSVEVFRKGWLRPTSLEGLVDDVVALAEAAESERPSKPQREAGA